MKFFLDKQLLTYEFELLIEIKERQINVGYVFNIFVPFSTICGIDMRNGNREVSEAKRIRRE